MASGAPVHLQTLPLPRQVKEGPEVTWVLFLYFQLKHNKHTDTFRPPVCALIASPGHTQRGPGGTPAFTGSSDPPLSPHTVSPPFFTRGWQCLLTFAHWGRLQGLGETHLWGAGTRSHETLKGSSNLLLPDRTPSTSESLQAPHPGVPGSEPLGLATEVGIQNCIFKYFNIFYFSCFGGPGNRSYMKVKKKKAQGRDMVSPDPQPGEPSVLPWVSRGPWGQYCAC